MQTQITPRRVIKEETEKLGKKLLRRPLSSNRSTRQSVGIHGWAKDPPSLIYPLYLSPPISYSNKASQNRVLSSTPDPAISSILHLPSLASSNASQQHQKPHLTLSKGVVSVCAINQSMVWKWRGRRWGNSTNKCVENCWYNNFKLSSVFARVFSQKLSFTFVGNEGIYSVGLESVYQIVQSGRIKSFAGVSQ